MGLKTRIVPVLLWDQHGAVKGKQFNPGRRIGSMRDRVQLLERREVDELIILDIAATPNNRGPRFAEVEELCSNLFMPVTVGGGVRALADIKRLLAAGADKVAISTAAILTPELITTASRKFGSQAVVVAVDADKDGMVTTHCGRKRHGVRALDWAQQAERLGAGEILLTAIDRDGTLEGYDIELIREVSEAVSIPVIACGGCGSYEHIAEVLHSTKAHAVAVGAAFQFMDMTPKGASRYLHDQGFQVRL